jgi:hypothetical protein
MSTDLQFGRDVQGYNAFAPIPSTNIWSATLESGTASSITIPSNFPQWVIAFSVSGGQNIWVDFTGATATVPAGNTFATTTSELNPGARFIYSFQRDNVTPTSISIVTNDTTADVSVSLYGLKNMG